MNQGQTFAAERRDGFLWAPKTGKNGRSFGHWQTMSMVRPSDVVLHYAKGAVRAISRATASASDAPRPSSLPDGVWDQLGWLLPVDMNDLAQPITLDEIPPMMRYQQAQPMFNQHGGVVQGYLYQVDIEWFAQFARHFADRLPVGVEIEARVPAEIAGGAENLLRVLIGEQLLTFDGDNETITAVRGSKAIVSSTGATQSQSVPVSDVQRALDLLQRDSSVICQPEHVGDHSTFIGAVLRTLPGTQLLLQPPTISLEPPSDRSTARPGRGTSMPSGPLDKQVTRNTRTEQPALRRSLVGNKSISQCALCGEEMPIEFLVAAHIKQRSLCSDEEKSDLVNIGMLACKFGCDDLYELGYISVDPSGVIVAASADELHGNFISSALARLAGAPCSAFTSANAKYFQWHRENKYRGGSFELH